MNLYLRYFQEETLVKTFDEAISFLESIHEIEVTNELALDVRDYWESTNNYPQRYKVRQRVYFIMIKTTAESLAEFKANNKHNKENIAEGDAPIAEESITKVVRKDSKTIMLTNPVYGWYEGTILFKRVSPIIGTNKFEYRDTRFSAFVKASCALECYDRIIEHLKSRQDVDLRSQFPSAKGNKFSFKFWGDSLPVDIAKN